MTEPLKMCQNGVKSLDRNFLAVMRMEKIINFTSGGLSNAKGLFIQLSNDPTS